MSRLPVNWTEANAEQDANNWGAILLDFLAVALNDDGTLKTPVALPSTPLSFTALNGSTNTTNMLMRVTGSGTTQQLAQATEITSVAEGGTSTGRIAGYFGAQTGGGTGSNTGNSIWGLNIIVQKNAADTNAQGIGIELNVNNNKADDPTDLSGSTLTYGYSANSNGSKISAIGFNVGGAGQWRRGLYISQGAIATSGYAFDYKGDGANGVATIGADASAEFNALTLRTALTPANGGTGVASYAVGDILYASGATTLSKLADVAAGSYLRSGGVTTAPVWSTLVLPNSATANRIAYATSSNTWGESANLTYDGTSFKVGTAVSTSAAAGDIVVPNARGLRVVNAAGTDTYLVTYVDSSDRVILAGSTNNIVLGWGGGIVLVGTTTTTNAAGSEIVNQNNKNFRGVNAANNGTIAIAKVDASNHVSIDVGAVGTVIGGVTAVGGAAISTTTALNIPAGTTGVSPLRIAHGSAPTSPVDGDMWTTSSGLFVRINGTTKTVTLT